MSYCLVAGVVQSFLIHTVCLFWAAGGAQERPEAAEGFAEEAAAGDEGEGPAPERTQPSSSGPEQTGGALPGAAEAQQDPKGAFLTPLLQLGATRSHITQLFLGSQTKQGDTVSLKWDSTICYHLLMLCVSICQASRHEDVMPPVAYPHLSKSDP